MSISSTAVEPLRFREALGHYASGITVITSLVDEEPIGFTCQSFYSVSMSPPLVSFSVMSGSASYPRIRQAGRFAVNILSNEQVRISNQFARRGTDKWHGIEWRESPLGNPLIAGSLHWLDCEIYAEHAAGDHVIVIGEVKALNLQEAVAAQPLLYFKGQYRNIAAHSVA
ncbi:MULTISPECIES: flavin reductase family protein [unclassified Herbaspirillum]|uniref:flavin reductase family protein n=1 Tax=unclassified Herbaspirillum TaxID=2624150 RepID=UPI00114FF208|nr:MULTISPECIES: flavin reductase family protein [unclassified Herbaspirillum]MBB5390310.1 flavin reductase (DIM6/NTAB) family NADH-FMN oxidoreductase RutF [Herbaspirillum sp. SJZ102]TQK09193.1 flavin reductase (DIM6/NTAB) family NADH-FMN oxidoreductase RutF [Herbaspirillum sp. SJZ130]TQK14120.1 flavin reductase (DIM6/NTAB) family NADH-FMN oxidoreductase RutF [Herbaspirillum sp. SJZ106]TWC69819.1 flavin reductase (DIM6/NTAB) family NADH-FMN oxidoreductase RutF [Herbaspirillum sp. SJZ099]